MTLEEKIEVAHNLTGEKLIELLLMYYSDIDNIFYDSFETYNVIKNEVIMRCKQ